MANDPELVCDVFTKFLNNGGKLVRLPQVKRHDLPRRSVLIARGTADAFALRHKFHDAKVSGKIHATRADGGIFIPRWNTRGSKQIGGRATCPAPGNIDAKIGNEAIRKGYKSATRPKHHWPQPRAI
jgi:cobaltochelatase CobT